MNIHLTLKSGKEIEVTTKPFPKHRGKLHTRSRKDFFKSCTDPFGARSSWINISTLLQRYPTARQISYPITDPQSGNIHTTTIHV